MLPIQVSRGRTAMARPARAHSPLEVGSAEPSTGRRGQNTHRPVITSNQAALWCALRTLGLSDMIPGLGALFQRDLIKAAA